MNSEELFGLRLENFPGRISDDDIEAAALVHHSVELVAPVERTQLCNIAHAKGTFLRFALGLFRIVPCCRFIFHAEVVELIQQEFVQILDGLFTLLLNHVAQVAQILSVL